jgi:hypothetical protein
MSKYTLCSGEGCPIKEDCGRYLPGLDKTKVNHFSPVPYKDGKCSFYVKFEPDVFKELTSHNNYEEKRDRHFPE